MSLDQILMLPPGYGFDSAGESDVAFTLTLDNLSTRFGEYNGAAATIKFKLTATNGGGALTTASFVYLDATQGVGAAGNTLDAIGDVATLIQTQLNALAGYSGVTVNGVATVPGDQWDFTITFPGALGVTDLAFHASSQWYPTIVLVEAVQQQGVDYDPGVKEVFTLTCTAPEDQTTGEVVGLTIPNIGAFNITFGANDTLIASIDPDAEYVTLAGGVGNSYVTMERSAVGAVDDVTIGSQSSNGTYSLTIDTSGADEVAALSEAHTITAYPVYPTGGSWAPHNALNAVSWNSDVVAIESALDTDFGVGVVDVTQGSGSGGISNGSVTVTWAATGSVNDDALSPVNVDLTAPEITHSIS